MPLTSPGNFSLLLFGSKPHREQWKRASRHQARLRRSRSHRARGQSGTPLPLDRRRVPHRTAVNPTPPRPREGRASSGDPHRLRGHFPSHGNLPLSPDTSPYKTQSRRPYPTKNNPARFRNRTELLGDNGHCSATQRWDERAETSQHGNEESLRRESTRSQRGETRRKRTIASSCSTGLQLQEAPQLPKETQLCSAPYD